MAKKIQIGQREFKTHKEAKNYYTSILNSNKDKSLQGRDFEDIFQLLINHPEARKKIGNGIKELKVLPSSYNNNYCFHLLREDDSLENFSIQKCISGDSSDFQKFSLACRNTIMDDLYKVKKEYFDKNSIQGYVKCQNTNELIDWKNAHIDHREPNTFSMIVDRFIELNKINLKDIKYDSTCNYGNEFDDESIKCSFKKYHSKRANLRIISKKNNLSKSYMARVNRNSKDLKIF